MIFYVQVFRLFISNAKIKNQKVNIIQRINMHTVEKGTTEKHVM